jgi:hypothetical protein
MVKRVPSVRVLVLCPAVLRASWQEQVLAESTRAILVDRYRFRQMLETLSPTECWPEGVVSVLGDDFARQQDISDSLASTHWGLLVADEAHRFVGSRYELLRRCAARADRVVLATASTLPVLAGPLADATVVNWERDQLVDREGRPVYPAPRPEIREVPYSLSAGEQRLARLTEELAGLLEPGDTRGARATHILLRGLHSSPAALESVLNRIAAPGGVSDESEAPLEGSAEESSEVGLPMPAGPRTDPVASPVIAELLEEFSNAEEDTKRAAFDGLLESFRGPAREDVRVCAIVEFRSTLFYLAAHVEGRGLPCTVIHGEMQREDRRAYLGSFLGDGGLLLATRAAVSEGFDLKDVTDLVLYDLPTGEAATQQLLGRFDRYGRTGQLRIHVLTQAGNTDPVEMQARRLVAAVVSG